MDDILGEVFDVLDIGVLDGDLDAITSTSTFLISPLY